MAVQAHRTTLKKSHKAFKSKHASKSALKARNKGKVEKDSKDSKRKPHELSKQERRNLAKQIRDTKVVDSLLERKFFEGRAGVPKIVSIIPLTDDSNPQAFVESLNKSLEIHGVDVPETGSVTVHVDKFRQKIRYVLPKRGNFLQMLEAAKCSDFVIFMLSATEEVDSYRELCIRTIAAQGVSTAVPVVFNLTESGSVKQQRAFKGSLLSFFSHFFPDTDKLYSLESISDSLNIARLLCDKLPKGIHWRDSRPYVLADNVYTTEDGLLAVEGVIRGNGLDVNRLMHIPGFGDYQVDRVESTVAPYTKQKPNGDVDLTANEIVASPDDSQDDLDELAPYDEDMDLAEDLEDQIFDADDQKEMGVRLDGHHYFKDPGLHTATHGIDEELAQRRATKGKVPKGTSNYQASWLIDDASEYQDEDDEEEEYDNEDIDMNVSQNGHSSPRVRFANAGSDDDSDEDDLNFEDMPREEEMLHLKEFRDRARDDLDFPDEIEIHPEVSAKERLQHYRGVKSLRLSNWDPNESDARRPHEWNRLLDIHNFKATRNRVFNDLAANKANLVPTGSYVRIVLRAPSFIAESYSKDSLFAVYGLLQYEHKLSVVNASITPDNEYTDPVKSEEDILMFCGPRRLSIKPLFSQSGNNSNNVYKYERFLQPGRASTATVIAPVTMDHTPVVYFKQHDDKLTLIGTGTILDTNKSRVLAKRAVLTGHAVKIHKKLVTVRYMFFNAEDVQWFKAVPLFTQSGRTGFIKESLGTHGYFKATFDGRISSQDTVGMALYKRVWPKQSQLWT